MLFRSVSQSRYQGGVGKTTVAAAIGWALANRHPDQKIRIISIDPAHSLGDAFGTKLGHQSTQLTANLSVKKLMLISF